VVVYNGTGKTANTQQSYFDPYTNCPENNVLEPAESSAGALVVIQLVELWKNRYCRNALLQAPTLAQKMALLVWLKSHSASDEKPTSWLRIFYARLDCYA
jgi:hypothetical protein